MMQMFGLMNGFTNNTKVSKDPTLIANSLIAMLKLNGFIVQKHVEKSGAVLIRLDCGMSNIIRIESLSKKRSNLKYMFLINSDQSIDNRIIESTSTQYVFGHSNIELLRLVQKINDNKQLKVKRAGGMDKFIAKVMLKQNTETATAGKWGVGSFV